MTGTWTERVQLWLRRRSRLISLVVLAGCLLAGAGAVLQLIPAGGSARADSGAYRAERTVTGPDGTCLALTATGRLRGTVQRHPLGPSEWSDLTLAYALDVRFAASCARGAAAVPSSGATLFERWWHGEKAGVERVPTDTLDVAGNIGDPGADWFGAGLDDSRSARHRFARKAVHLQGVYRDDRMCLVQEVVVRYARGSGDVLTRPVTLPPVCFDRP